jgi:hypothetical protein
VNNRSRGANDFEMPLRAETLADALIGLDFVLDVDLRDPADATTTSGG